LPLRGLGALLERAGRPADEVAEAEARATTSSPSARRRPSSTCVSPAHRPRADKLAGEYAELLREIERLRAILASPELLMAVIVMELEDDRDEVRRRAAHRDRAERGGDRSRRPDPRRGHGRHDLARRLPQAHARQRVPRPARGGKGKIGMEARDEDWVSQLFVASTHSFVFFFAESGKVYVKKVYEIPQARAPRRAARS
jgi:DNA gyrase subunit A